MSVLTDLAERLKGLFDRARGDRELDEELRFHVDREVQERVRAGADPADARRRALAALGGIERTKDEVREARGVQPLFELKADLRYALRALRMNPGFTAAVVAVLGLGIGASTAVFAVVDTVLFSDLPYPRADALVRVVQQSPTARLWQLSTVDFQAIRGQQRSFDAFGVVQRSAVSMSGAGAPQRVQAVWASAGFFDALGVRAERGRLLLAADEVPGAPPVVVVTHAVAQERLGGAAAAVGGTLTIDGIPHTVVGVLPRGRDELAGMRAGLWPVLQVSAPTRRGPFWLRGFGRLKPGVTLAQANRDIAAISLRIYPQWSSSFQDDGMRYSAMPLRAAIVGPADTPMGLFAAAVALVLLVAIANVATLVLVRASAREHELAMRAALGASRGRIARLLLTECLALTLLAGLAGIGIARAGIALLGSLAPALPRLQEIALGGRSVAFAAAAVLASGILISLSPAWGVLSGHHVPSLRADSRRAGTGRGTNAVRGTLVALEFALALPLLVGAGLLLASFVRLQRVDPGFAPEGAVSVDIALPSARYAQPQDVQRFWRQLEARVRAIPGVTASGLSSTMPPDNGGDVNNFDLLDRPTPAGVSQPVVPWATVSSGFFPAMGIALLEGRMFGAGDSATAPPVAIASRSWARHYYPRESAIGKRFYSAGCTTCPPVTVVGIVGDVKYLGLTQPGEAMYAPVEQDNPNFMTLVVRSPASAAEAFRAIHGAVGAVDPEIAAFDQTLRARLQDSLADPERWTSIIGAFGAAALLLAALGIFGLMSYVVRQRRHELGVRLALGAEPAALVRMIVARGMRYALAGLAVGLGLSFVAARWLGALLYGVGATDPGTLALVSGLLLGVALLACWIPGRRASRIKPIEALASD